jgi:hypothetical protein
MTPGFCSLACVELRDGRLGFLHQGNEGREELRRKPVAMKSPHPCAPQMKMICVIVFWVCCSAAFAQGTFQNLDFESASLTPISAGQDGGEIPLGSALPDWSATIAGSPVTQVLQNNLTITAASIDILGPNWNSDYPGIISGQNTAILESLAFPGTTDDASIFQTGTIPIGSESLQLKAWSIQPNSQFTVSINGNILSPVALSAGQSASGQPFTLYGFNVASFAGISGQLAITTVVPNGNGISQVEFDDISFSPNAITVTPEPDALTLMGLGGLVFGVYQRVQGCRK